jgi:RimJ/RimL family protein N-acetyltransferase
LFGARENLAFRNVEGHHICGGGNIEADKQMRGVSSRGKYATNPFFLEDLFDTTIHEHHNNWPYWYTDSTLGKFGGLYSISDNKKRQQPHLGYILSKWHLHGFGFEASNPLESC